MVLKEIKIAENYSQKITSRNADEIFEYFCMIKENITWIQEYWKILQWWDKKIREMKSNFPAIIVANLALIYLLHLSSSKMPGKSFSKWNLAFFQGQFFLVRVSAVEQLHHGHYCFSSTFQTLKCFGHRYLGKGQTRVSWKGKLESNFGYF